MAHQKGWKEMKFNCPFCKKGHSSYPVEEADPIICPCGAYLQVISEYGLFKSTEDVLNYYGIPPEELDEEDGEPTLTDIKKRLKVKKLTLGEDDEGELFYIECYMPKGATKASPQKARQAAPETRRNLVIKMQIEHLRKKADPDSKTYQLTINGESYDYLIALPAGNGSVYIIPASYDSELVIVGQKEFGIEYLPDYVEETLGIRWQGYQAKSILEEDIPPLKGIYPDMTHEERNYAPVYPLCFDQKKLPTTIKHTVYTAELLTRFEGYYSDTGHEFEFTSYQKNTGYHMEDKPVTAKYSCPSCGHTIELPAIIEGSSVICVKCKKTHTLTVQPV